MSYGTTDAVADLGCEMGLTPTANNAALINTGLQSSSHPYGVNLRSGILRATEKIVMPASSGHGLSGQGCSCDINDASARHGKSSRIIGNYSTDDVTMIEMQSIYSRLQNLHLQGRAVPAGGSLEREPPTEADNRAKIGIHIPTLDVSGLPGSKSILDNISLYQIAEAGILIGSHLDDVGVDNFTGIDATHADTLRFGTIHGHGHYAGSVHSNTGRCVHVRTLQSLGNHFGRISTHGNYEDAVYLEAGGSTIIGQLICNVDGSGTTTMLRVGRLSGHGVGNLMVHQLFMDAAGVGAKAFAMDYLPSHAFNVPRIVFGQCHIPEPCVATPQFDCFAGQILIHNTGVLQAGSIQLTGDTAGSDKLVCHVVLYGCTLMAGVDPADLIHASSVGPYVLTWRDCVVAHDSASPKIWFRPIVDGEILSGVTRLAA